MAQVLGCCHAAVDSFCPDQEFADQMHNGCLIDNNTGIASDITTNELLLQSAAQTNMQHACISFRQRFHGNTKARPNLYDHNMRTCCNAFIANASKRWTCAAQVWCTDAPTANTDSWIALLNCLKTPCSRNTWASAAHDIAEKDALCAQRGHSR